ncbi:hypothetical protein [Cytobacillus firmus]|nr:hypothetical protein [Cytobacillus firmus]MED1942625.1 hypothetical protein [Cytobacillus firmus]
MGTIIIIGVMVAFLAAIFTAGYDDKPGVSKKGSKSNVGVM